MKFRNGWYLGWRKYKWILKATIVISIVILGVNYLDWCSVNAEISDFIFSSEYEHDFCIKLNQGGKSEKLDVFIINSGKTLEISGMEAIDMEKLLSGEASLCIEYQLKSSDNYKRNLTIEDEVFDLGTCPFKLTADDPYWRICNKNGSWGIGQPEVGIPKVVVDLLPTSLGDLRGYNKVEKSNNGVIIGRLTILQRKPQKMKKPEIDLSSLRLPDAINQEIISGGLEFSDLEIRANYSFSIPLVFEQADSKHYVLGSKEIQIEGKATMNIHCTVNHDLSPMPAPTLRLRSGDRCY